MKDIKAMKGRYYIRELVSAGEHERQDFKFSVNDPRKIARSLSAFANRSGGHLLIGVKDNGTVAGVKRPDEEIYIVEQAAERYCRPSQHVEFTLFSVEPGVSVIRASIEATAEPPVEVDEGGGILRAYYRVADENITAHPLMVEAWHRRSTCTGLTLNFEHDGLPASVLRALAAGPMPVERIALNIHASTESVTETVISLASLKLIDFRFDGHGFLPALPSE